MHIRVNVKQMGKRRQAVEERLCEIAGCPGTVRELILAVVASEVEAYNQRLKDAGESLKEDAAPREDGLLKYLTREEIGDQAQTGKISFGALYGEKEADQEEAAANALQSFEDGIYRIFLDGKPLETLDEQISVTEETVFTFVRLVMLAGRMW